MFGDHFLIMFFHSVEVLFTTYDSQVSGKAFVEHFDSQQHDHRAEYDAQPFGFRFDQNPRAHQRAGQNAKHDGHGESRVDIATVQINAGAGGGGDADHEVAGGGGDLEGNLHGLVHGENLHGAGADAQESGQSARPKHYAEARRHALDIVAPHSLQVRKAAVQAQSRGQ